MVKMINLNSDEVSIKLAFEENGWCRVYLENTKKIFLGADVLERICNRFLSALREEYSEREMCDYRGTQVFYITSLFEAHAAIYSSSMSEVGMKLFCIEDGSLIAHEIVLSKNDIANWIELLERSNYL